MATVLAAEAIQSGLKGLAGWTYAENAIHKTYTFKDFKEAVLFVNAVSHLAEVAQHHPDIDIRWNKVTLVLSSHSAGGVTENDLGMATRIEGLLKT